jgi:hypothetical protein
LIRDGAVTSSDKKQRYDHAGGVRVQETGRCVWVVKGISGPEWWYLVLNAQGQVILSFFQLIWGNMLKREKKDMKEGK